MLKLDTKQFIERSLITHGNIYDYHKSVYTGALDDIIIICKRCGLEFYQRASDHSHGKGCPNPIHLRSTTEEFIAKAKKIHKNNEFNYDKTIYVKAIEKVIITCNKCHRDFMQSPNKHLCKRGCPKCLNKSLTTKEFIELSKSIHGPDTYDYNFVNYINHYTEITLICNKCDVIYNQLPRYHLRPSKHKFCYHIPITTEEFIRRSNLRHNFKYDYSKTKYTLGKNKVIITCKKCKCEFEQQASAHLRGEGCPKCRNSHGESSVENYLIKLAIKYDTQVKFDGCIGNTKALSFDFYIKEYNLAIEYDGEQHYILREKFGGEKEFNLRQRYDLIKDEFCLKSKINLLRIPYFKIDELEKNINLAIALIKNGKYVYVHSKFDYEKQK